MKTTSSICLLIASLLLFPLETVCGNILLELNLDGGYTDNLLNDSSRVNDRFSVSSLSLRLYPTSRTELNVSGESMYYDHNADISNYSTRAEFSYLPLSLSSRYSIFLSSSLEGRRYHSAFAGFDNNNFQARAAFGLELTQTTSVRAGVRFNEISYLGSDSGDRSITELYAGLNSTWLSRTSIDVEFGYGFTDYRFVDRNLLFIDIEDPDGALLDGTLKTVFVSPRISRSIGQKVGMNLTLTYRSFPGESEEIVYGSSVGLLSPWTSIWQGTSATLSVKSYLVPQTIMTAGLGFWDREHLQTMESDVFPVVRGRSREDAETRLYLRIARPFKVGSGFIVQPHIQVDFTNNNSTNELFDYTGFSANTGLNVRM